METTGKALQRAVRQKRSLILKLNKLKRRNIALEARNAILEDRANPDACFKVVRHGSCARNFAQTARLVVAIRRNLTSISSSDFQSIIMTDVSRQVVVRHEVEGWAARVGFIRDTYNTEAVRAQELQEAANGEVPAFAIATHAFRGDLSGLLRTFVVERSHCTACGHTCMLRHVESRMPLAGPARAERPLSEQFCQTRAMWPTQAGMRPTPPSSTTANCTT